eukprot:3100012-Pleurochrysis_carterae.AAC.1
MARRGEIARWIEKVSQGHGDLHQQESGLASRSFECMTGSEKIALYQKGLVSRLVNMRIISRDRNETNCKCSRVHGDQPRSAADRTS